MQLLTIASLTVLAGLVSNVSAGSQSLAHFGFNPSFGISSRVTNGQAAVPNAYPFQLSLQWRRWSFNSPQPVCGASLINSLWAVTAAHCFHGDPNHGIYSVFAGKHNIHANEANQQSRTASLIIVHPAWLGGVNPHDIGLIKVDRDFDFNAFVAPIALPKINALHSGFAVITGWGSTSITTAQNRPIVLQEATIPIIDTGVCYDVLSTFAEDPPLDVTKLDNVCAGYLDPNPRISVCSGDSGGPLAQLVGDKWELVGVISYTVFPCGSPGAPSVSVRTSAYIDWIDEHIAANS